MSNIPKLRFPEFSGEWEEKKLSDFMTRLTRKNSNNESSRALTISSVDGLIDQGEFFKKQIASKDTSGYYLLKKGDFAYNKSYSVGYDYGSIKRLDRYEDGVVSTLYICMSLTSDTNSDYLTHYFDSMKWNKSVSEISAEGARNHGLLNIPTEAFFQTKHFLAPSSAEQQKIANFLSNVDSIITAETKILNTLQKKKKALMQKLFTRQLRFKSDDGTDFPAWEETLIKNIALQVTVGIANSATHAYRADGVIMFRNQNIKENYLDDTDIIYISNDFEETYKNKRLKKYDILVTRTGYPGIACVVPEKYENAQTFTTLILRLKLEKCNPFYICQFINSPLGKKYIKLTQIGGGQKNSGVGILEKMPIKLPCIEEQQKIADCLSSIDSLIQNQQKVVTTWQQRKKALLQQMFI